MYTHEWMSERKGKQERAAKSLSSRFARRGLFLSLRRGFSYSLQLREKGKNPKIMYRRIVIYMSSPSLFM